MERTRAQLISLSYRTKIQAVQKRISIVREAHDEKEFKQKIKQKTTDG